MCIIIHIGGGILVRINITLPDSIASELKQIPNKSRLIAELLQREIEERKQTQLEKQLEKGYKNTKSEDSRINEEWETITLQSWK